MRDGLHTTVTVLGDGGGSSGPRRDLHQRHLPARPPQNGLVRHAFECRPMPGGARRKWPVPGLWVRVASDRPDVAAAVCTIRGSPLDVERTVTPRRRGLITVDGIPPTTLKRPPQGAYQTPGVGWPHLPVYYARDGPG